MIRKLNSGEYRLYSRKKEVKTGKRRNRGTFSSLAAAKKHGTGGAVLQMRLKRSRTASISAFPALLQIAYNRVTNPGLLRTKISRRSSAGS
jgi:hypothetical protein